MDKLNELEGRLEAVVEVEDFDEADILLIINSPLSNVPKLPYGNLHQYT